MQVEDLTADSPTLDSGILSHNEKHLFKNSFDFIYECNPDVRPVPISPQ